jgi:hypothetical protein
MGGFSALSWVCGASGAFNQRTGCGVMRWGRMGARTIPQTAIVIPNRSNQWGETSPLAELPMLEISGQVTDMAGELETEQRERLILL